MNASELMSGFCNQVARHSRSAMVAAAAIVAVGSTAASAAIVSDNFEAFTGANGATVAGYSNWNVIGTSSTIVNNDATAYDGTHYLQLNDTTTNAQGLARKNFGAAPISSPISANGATVSFALREDANFNVGQFVLYANNSTSLIAAQLGITPTTAGGAGTFTYRPFSNTTASAAPITLVGLTPTAGVWYFFTLNYAFNATTQAGTYSLSIKDTATNTTVNYSNLSGNTGFATGTVDFTYAAVTSGTSGIGNVDFDALTLATPEPASLGLVALVGGVLLRRRSR